MPSENANRTPAATAAKTSDAGSKGKVWIDLDNSPHVPLFAPIVQELEKLNFSVVLTARDAFQVREIADLMHLKYRLIGHHSGKNKIRKMAGLCVRAMELMPIILRESPDLAVSVCSRSQLIAAALLRLRTFCLGDYEFAKGWAFIKPTWLMCPEVIPDSAIQLDPERIMKFPGIKEDIYVPRFSPDAGLRAQLGLEEHDVVATIRPPAREAHYHNPHSDELFAASVEFLSRYPDVRMVLLPRTPRQGMEIKERWPELFANGKMRIPEHVVDGLNLIWNSDFVISGGGTMNREASALGVPVYSVFRGKIGAVDHYLASQGRLVLLEGVGDLEAKLLVARRDRQAGPEAHSETILQCIVRQITTIVECGRPTPDTAQRIRRNQLAAIR